MGATGMHKLSLSQLVIIVYINLPTSDSQSNVLHLSCLEMEKSSLDMGSEQIRWYQTSSY